MSTSMMNEAQIKNMVDRFLAWRLPKDFRPDAGVSYARPNYPPIVDATPTGTNLLNSYQAEAMVRHMIENIWMFANPDSDGPTPENETFPRKTVRLNFSPEGEKTLTGRWRETNERTSSPIPPPINDLIAALVAALQQLHDNNAEYGRINNLGGYDNQDMQAARAALKLAGATP